MRVAVAGATGLIGKHLLSQLGDAHEWIALSRREKESTERVTWRSCNLFSLLDAEEGVRGADVGIYLVHSMMPSARLTQGHFADLDLVAADNFARAAAKEGLKQIIYIGGLLPDIPEEALSTHLKSRLEVERTLGAYGVPVTTLRAGLVLGRGGSSFQMLLRLVHRLPVMVCPAWTDTPTHPIALDDIVALMGFCIGKEETYGETYDVGCEETITYRELILKVGEHLGRTPMTFNVPFFTPELSRLWVSMVTGAPKELVAPLIKSLSHQMCVKERRLQTLAGHTMLSVDQALTQELEAPSATDEQPVTYNKPRAKRESEVCSVQRMPLPAQHDAAFVAQEYMRWLPRLLPWFLAVDIDEEQVCCFRIRWMPFCLLKLQLSPERSTPDRQLFYIRGGLLARTTGRGRLEFREVLDGQHVIAAIHDFRPTLPWFIYRLTQAPTHLWVMNRFSSHLRSLKSPPTPQHAPS